jgi:hypothetical protein
MFPGTIAVPLLKSLATGWCQPAQRWPESRDGFLLPGARPSTDRQSHERVRGARADAPLENPRVPASESPERRTLGGESAKKQPSVRSAPAGSRKRAPWPSMKISEASFAIAPRKVSGRDHGWQYAGFQRRSRPRPLVEQLAEACETADQFPRGESEEKLCPHHGC